MATLITRERKGSVSHEIKFYDNGVCRMIWLGKRYTTRTARELKGVVEDLLNCRLNGVEHPGKRTVGWIESAPAEIREKLAQAGLIEIPPSHTLKELWDAFLAEKDKERKAGTIKDATLHLYTHVRKRFFLFFDSDEPLDGLTKERMQRWKNHLLDELAKASVACFIKQAKSCFNWAKDQGWIETSPLNGVGKGSFINRKNNHIVSMVDYCKMLDSCPCQDWRTILALVRIGGLRCPSEVLELRWENVNRKHNRFFVRSPKTEHHEGGDGRWVPIFPELREELEMLWNEREAVWSDLPENKRQFVINRYRDASQNLRTTFEKIVRRAGLLMFPRPFDNMRMTRSNEIKRRWPERESAWIGHSHRVWTEHYSENMDSDFAEAAVWDTPSDSMEHPAQNRWEKSGQTVLPPKLPPAQDGTGLHGVEDTQRTDSQ